MSDTKTPNATQLKNDLINDPSIRFWLKKAITDLEDRDPVDALNDVVLLKRFCELRLKDIQTYYK